MCGTATTGALALARIKKADREAVVAALLDPKSIDDVDDDTLEEVSGAAERAVEALDAVRASHLAKASNRPYVVLMQLEGESMVFTYGPYETMAKAKRAQGNLVSPGPGEARSVIRRLIEVPE